VARINVAHLISLPKGGVILEGFGMAVGQKRPSVGRPGQGLVPCLRRLGYLTLTASASSGLSGRLAYGVGPDRFASLFAVEDSWEKYEGAAVKEQRNNQCEVALIHKISRCKFSKRRDP
jgi:hypothetical protein